ncbi:hypothetical protein [Parasulfitobacter algicola]|uniref:Ankyrin n=1 Tax=Parasulfitobacter algicola TaxID=2614809 RepID=A0ABX2IZX7_9RHOB|nr:hypothetical protein [Sulfitobacter algicola]NSX57010.1 hypothetical protein [Sulfitobacter algicola]
MRDTLERIVVCLDDDDARTKAANMAPNASEALRAELANLYAGEAPQIEALRALGDEIDLKLRPVSRPPHTTFLTEAVNHKNYAWTRALLEAGADPNASGSLMAYNASREIFNDTTRAIQTFADGTPAIPFLQAYLDHGGALDTTAGGDYGNATLIEAPFRNLPARAFLLEQGADPWLTARTSHLAFGSTFAWSYIRGVRASDYAEELYVLLRRGLIPPPPSEDFQARMQRMIVEDLQEFGPASGPSDRQLLWRIQKVADALIEQGVMQPTPEITALLERDRIPDSDVDGWYLAKDQLHQAPDDHRRGTDPGSEVW